MRLVAPRLTSARMLLLAAASAALVSTVLLTAFLQYAYLLPTAGVRAAVIASPANEHALVLNSAAGRSVSDLAVRERVADELFGTGIAGVDLRVHAGGHAISQQLPGHGDTDAVVAYLTELPAHADLVDGSWPEPGATGGAAEVPVQATLPAAVADRLELVIGEALTVHDGRLGEDRPVVLVGTWEPHDPGDAYWRLASAPLDRGGVGPFVLHRDDFAEHYLRLANLEWVAVPDLERLTEVGLHSVLAGYDRMLEELPRLRAETGEQSMRLSTGLDHLAERLVTAEVVNRSGLVLPAALLVLITWYGLALVARLLAAQRRGENALLRARGASRAQLFLFTLLEALLVVTPAALLAAPLGTQLVAYADGLAGHRSLGLADDLAPYGWPGPLLAWVIALAAAACCALALAAPGAGRGRTWVAEMQERSRPSRTVRELRGGLDIALVVIALLAWSQLRRYETTVLFLDTGVALDPLLVAAPVVAVVAGTAAALRLLPLATRLVVRLAERGRAFAGLLGVWQADRRPHAGPVLLLVLAVATAVLAPAVATTWQRSQHDQAAHAVGADVRLDRVPPSAAHELADLPAVTGLVAVHRRTVVIPGDGAGTLLAFDAARAAGVVHLRGGAALGRPEQVFAALADGRAALAGVPLPAGAQRLVGEVRFRGAEPVTIRGTVETADFTIEFEETARGPTGGRPAIHVADADGLMLAVPLGDSEGGVWQVDLALPPQTTTLVGFSSQLRVPSLPSLPCVDEHNCPRWSEFGLGTMEVAWDWDLRSVDASGFEVPVEVPAEWDVHIRERRAGSPLTFTGNAVTAVVHPAGNAGMTLPFRIGQAAPDVPAVPAVVTPPVLAGTGAEVGGLVTLGGVRMRVVDTVPAVPGTEARAAVMVDLGALSVRRLADGMATPPEAEEWWVASRNPSGTAAAAGRLGFAVHDRTAVERGLTDDPLGVGMLLTLWAAALGAGLLAALGLTVDARATALGRQRELAVLHTLGVAPGSLARGLVVEQAVLAGLGVAVGAVVGVLVAAAMGPSLVLTPAGAVPVPEPLLALSGGQLAAPLLGLFALAVVLGALVSRRARRELAAGGLRIGAD